MPELVNVKIGDEMAFVLYGGFLSRYEVHAIEDDESLGPGYIRCGPYVLDQNLHVFSGGGASGPHYGMPVTDQIRLEVRVNNLRRELLEVDWEFLPAEDVIRVAETLDLEKDREDA